MHYEVYHAYHSEKAPFSNLISRFLAKMAKFLAILGIILIVVSFLPSVFYEIRSGGAKRVSELLGKPFLVQSKIENQPPTAEIYQPGYDPKLSFENRIKIPSIKIDTPIWEATADNFESALKKGVWRVSDFGTPYDRSKPTILAAHRYGYLVWSIPYRLKNSFYNLPKLKVGDIVEIIWRQRKYVYEVYAESKGEEITDYSASLILYSCEALNSPVRIFKYAKLLEI